MPDRGKGALYRVGCSDVLPVFCWEIIEGQENVAVFGQFPHRLVIFNAIGFDKEIECGFSIGPSRAARAS